MTKHTDEFSQFTEPVTCREYTLPRDENSTDLKGWIRGNTKIGPLLEVTTSYLQGEYGVEIKVESVNKVNSHSWIRISHGLNKLVTDLIDKEYDDNEQETSEMKFEEFALKTNVLAFASRSKAKAKPRRRTSACSSTRTVPIRGTIWTDIEPGAQFDQAYPVARRLNTLLRHGEWPREEDGATEFWRLKDDLWNKFEYSQYWSDDVWKSNIAGSGGNNNRFQIMYWLVRTRNSLSPSSSRSFRTQSHWSCTAGQCVNSKQFFEYIYHIRCAISLHSITNSGFIARGQNSIGERQTVFLTAVNPMDKNHKDPQELDVTEPRLASYKQKKWKRHQDTVHWVDFQLAQRKGLKFYQTRCNAIIFYDTLPAYCISKVVVMKSEKIIHQKVLCHLDHHRRFPTKIIGWKNWIQRSLEAAKRPNEPKPKAQLSRTVRPVGGQESTKVEELDIGFRVPGLSHSVVKEAEHLRVQELVKKIESHLHREALQADLQQKNVYNPFINNSKAMIRELGNVELFELCETTPRVQCAHCLLYWNQGIVYCTCGQFLVESESRRNFPNQDWMHSLSRTTW